MFTPMKPTGFGMLNDTVLNTPQPQATSTVQRKYTLEGRFHDKGSDEEKHHITVNLSSCENEQKTEDSSSLGLLDDISSVLTNISTTDDEQRLNYLNTDTELEFARKLLQRCSNLNNFNTDVNKENNANVQNVTDISNCIVENNNHIADAEKRCNTSSLSNKFTTTSINFEPEEISARSSALDKTEEEKQYTLNKSCDGISFSSATAKIMAQYNNEEFLSGSRMAEQLSADEASWKQNCTYAMPNTNTEKHELDLSSFSGIIGQIDLSLESCAGTKVSVGQYFKRKGGNIGVLEGHQRIRPSLGFETPMKSYNLEPLIDSAMTNALLTESEEKEHNPNTVIDMDNILSLSTIANTLQDVHSGTPRRLVDQLLMVRKKKKYSELQHNARKETYTMPSERKSMIATPIANVNKFDENISIVNLATKLSLDSRIDNESIDINMKQQLSRMLSFASSKNTKNAESFVDTCKEQILKEETDRKSASCLLNQHAVSDFKCSQESALLLPNDKLDILPSISCKVDIKNDRIYSNMKTQDVKKKDKKKDMKKQNISENKMNSSFCENANSEMQLNSNRNVVISRNTEQLCNCIVGMTCEANIELLNIGDRWITYSLNLNEIRGDKQSIILNIPEDASLIKPNGTQSTKIGVKVKKMCKPIIAVLNIIISDMVAKSKWCIKHMICFKPEELELDITSESQKQELDFQYVIENLTNTLPIYLQNKNSIDMPIKLSMLHDGPKMFSINGTSSELTNFNKLDDDVYYFVLKPHVKLTIDIKCEGLQSSIPTEFSQRQPSCWKSKLVIQIQYSDNTTLLVKEVPIYAQLGTCEIQVTDTDIPLIVSQQQSLNIINSGNVATHVSAFIISVEGYSNAAQDCTIEPENIFLQVKEKGSFLITYKPQNSNVKLTDNERCIKIKLVAGNNVYYYPVTIKLKPAGLENENYSRCNTPNNIVSSTSPTSPHSIISNKSEVYDRQSPSSTVSSITVAGNVIPIKSTHAALVWNSVKTGRNGIKEFTIRNTSNNKIKIQIDVWDDNKSFKLLRDRQIVSTGMVLTMQRTESKTLSVMFSPYYIGPVNGKITIKHYTFIKDNSESQPYKRISLCGYGGYGNVKVFDTFKDATGKMWLSLGTLFSGAMTLRANIKLQNTGDLHSFAKIKVIPKVISPTMDSSWHINPKELILNPKETRQVSIEFHPNREEFAMLQRSDVSHVATLNITYGDEPTRWRIRRLYSKIKESGELMGNEKQTFKSIVYPLCKAFPDEEMISGLTLIRDSIQNLNDLCTGVHQYEIMLTVEASADDTMSVLHDTDDESQIYYSLCDNSHIDETSGASFFASQSRREYEIPDHELREDQFIVTPSTVILNPPVQREVTVNILSFFKVAQAFQTCLSDPDYFTVIPSEGMLPSKKSFPLKIRYLQRVKRNMQALLEIYTENEKQDVLIKVNAK